MLERLYHLYYRELYLYIYGMCRQESLTEDILQETYLRALISLKDSHTNMRAWLYMVARNLCLNELKKKKQTIALDEFDLQENQDLQSDVLHQIISVEEKRLLWNALMRLDEFKREVILLQYFGDFSHKEIAVILQISPENVRVLGYRAKKELQKMLGGNI